MIEFQPSCLTISSVIKVVPVTVDLLPGILRISSVRVPVPPAGAVLYPGASQDRYFFGDHVCAVCAGLLLDPDH